MDAVPLVQGAVPPAEFDIVAAEKFGETALGGTLLVYPKEVRAQALREAKKMREGGQVVQMMRKSSKKEIEEYVAYAKRNGNDSLIYLTKDGEKQQMIEAK